MSCWNACRRCAEAEAKAIVGKVQGERLAGLSRRSVAGHRGKLGRAPRPTRPAILRAIGAFGADAAPAVKDVTRRSAILRPMRYRRGMALSQMGTAGAAAVPALERSLSDPDARVRSVSAIALRAMGPSAAGATAGLVKALDDPSLYVRAVAADALGNLGPAAQIRGRALEPHLNSANEPSVFVLRSLASALGNIGPAAASALPALEQAAKIRGVNRRRKKRYDDQGRAGAALVLTPLGD